MTVLHAGTQTASTDFKADLLREPKGRPRLLVLEGPAGVGKTTLIHPVLRELKRRGIRAHAVSEFSSSPLGVLLCEGAAFGTPRRPPWLSGLAGLVAFLADRIASLENALAEPDAVYVCDRFIISEAILALQAICSPHERVVGAEIINSLLSWANARFATDSVIILLESNNLEDRLRTRLGRDLDPSLRAKLASERALYQYAAGLSFGWEVQAVSTDIAPDTSCAALVTRILQSWTR